MNVSVKVREALDTYANSMYWASVADDEPKETRDQKRVTHRYALAEKAESALIAALLTKGAPHGD